MSSTYICSYCKSGIMNTAEQYLKHINGVKHKKKAFQLQAPFEGIEYEEFQRVQPKKVTEGYMPEVEDFPTLTINSNNSQSLTSNKTSYEELRNKLAASHPERINDNESDEKSEEEVLEYNCVSLEDIFKKPNSKPSSAHLSIETFLKNKKTAAQTMNEIAQLMEWEIDFQQSAGKTERYKIDVSVDGFRIGEGEGENKKLAKQNASAQAIKDIKRKLEAVIKGNKLEAVGNKDQQEKPLPKNNENPADAYRSLALDKLREIEFCNLNKYAVPRRFAAFIITDQPDQLAKDGVVVAFGAGKGALSDSALYDICMDNGFNQLPGYFIRNFDCLVLAKKSLQCFFYNQLLMFFNPQSHYSRREKVYLEIGRNGMVCLKKGCRLHLYLSHAPYGDCVESIPLEWKEEKHLTRKEVERDKNGLVEPIMFMTYNNNQYIKQPGHIRVLTDAEAMKWMSLVDYRSKFPGINKYVSMSPTDKLTTWIHIGIQGALLSHIMSPVFLYSIQFGSDYMHQHISRALLCRVPLESLQKDYGNYYRNIQYKDPFIDRVYDCISVQPPNRHLKNSDVCFNWYLNPVSNYAEMIDVKTGCVHNDSPFKLPQGEPGFNCSRLSKVCMVVRLKQVFKTAVDFYALKPELRRNRDIQGISDAAKYNYFRLKNSARDYRQLKHCLFDLLRQRRYGDWQPNEDSNKFDLMDYYIINTSNECDDYED